MLADRSNFIVSSLPPELRKRLLAHAEHVSLPVGSHLYHPDRPPPYVHLTTSGIASLLTTMANGEGVEVGLHGPEGAVESLHLLGPELGTTDCFVQVESSAWRIDFRRFQDDFYPLQSVRSLIHRHVQYLSLIAGQIAACNGLHDVEERLARWLLMVADRLGESRFRLSQDSLAEMIGSRPSVVALTASVLRRSGLIDYRRDELEIIDRSSLEDAACECYSITRTLLHNFRAPKVDPEGPETLREP